MAQTVLKAVYRRFLRWCFRPFFGPPFPVSFQRRFVELAARTVPRPKGVDVEELHGIRPRTFRVGSGTDDPERRPALLWIHGGAFLTGSAVTHGGLAAHLALAAAGDVYLPEYRLAPENPFPAATDDAFRAYEAVLARGHDPARVAIGGDSAGGAIATLTALAIREMDVPTPAAMVLISPVTDLSLSGATVESKEKADVMLRRAWLEHGYRAFAGTLALTDPRVSPLFADLHGLPPTLIQVGEDEMLLDDSLRLADRAWGAGVEVELQRFPGMWHDFQIQASLISDSADAVGDIGAFLRRRFSSA